MRRVFSIILLVSFIINGCVWHNKNKPERNGYNVKIEISNEWIEKVRRFNYTRNTEGILKEFESFIKPDTLIDPHAQHVNEGYGRVLNPMFVDLDGEPGEELICLLGWDVGASYLGVFKQIQGQWYLLYLEYFDMFNTGTDLSVANNFSKNKVFYMRRLYSRGTCVYSDGYSFYKLINNKIYKCLELVNEASTCGWTSSLNQDVKLTFNFSGDDKDGLSINYIYNFDYIPKDPTSLAESSGASLIRGDAGATYYWDNKSQTYKLDTSLYNNEPYYLTAKQIACFGDFKNDSLFIDAFKVQIDTVLKNGTQQQKKLIKELRDKFNK